MKKTLLAGFLTLSLLAALTVPAFATGLVPEPYDTPEVTTTELQITVDSPSNWAVAQVSEAISLGLVPERLQSSYTANITREEYCELVIYTMAKLEGMTTARFMELYSVDNWIPFDDCDELHVTVARNRKVVRGVSDTLFAPSNLITRQEAAVMAANMMASFSYENRLDTDTPREYMVTYNSSDAVSFSDSDKFASWSDGAISYVSAIGIMNGTGNNEFTPLANYTREQAIVTLLRLHYVYLGDPLFTNVADAVYVIPRGDDTTATPIEVQDVEIPDVYAP